MTIYEIRNYEVICWWELTRRNCHSSTHHPLSEYECNLLRTTTVAKPRTEAARRAESPPRRSRWWWAREEKGKLALLSKLRLSAEHEEKCREKWTQAFRLPRIEEGFFAFFVFSFIFFNSWNRGRRWQIVRRTFVKVVHHSANIHLITQATILKNEGATWPAVLPRGHEMC